MLHCDLCPESIEAGEHAVDGPYELTAADIATLRSTGSYVPPDPSRDYLAEQAAHNEKLTAKVLVGALTIDQVALRLGISDAEAVRRIGARELMAVEVAAVLVCPLFQFTTDGTKVLPGFPAFLQALPHRAGPWEARWILERPHGGLAIEGQMVSPRTWMDSGGDLEELAMAVRGIFEHH